MTVALAKLGPPGAAGLYNQDVLATPLGDRSLSFNYIPRKAERAPETGITYR